MLKRKKNLESTLAAVFYYIFEKLEAEPESSLKIQRESLNFQNI